MEQILAIYTGGPAAIRQHPEAAREYLERPLPPEAQLRIERALLRAHADLEWTRATLHPEKITETERALCEAIMNAAYDYASAALQEFLTFDEPESPRFPFPEIPGVWFQLCLSDAAHSFGLSDLQKNAVGFRLSSILLDRTSPTGAPALDVTEETVKIVTQEDASRRRHAIAYGRQDQRLAAIEKIKTKMKWPTKIRVGLAAFWPKRNYDLWIALERAERVPKMEAVSSEILRWIRDRGLGSATPSIRTGQPPAKRWSADKIERYETAIDRLLNL